MRSRKKVLPESERIAITVGEFDRLREAVMRAAVVLGYRVRSGSATASEIELYTTHLKSVLEEQ